MSQASPDGQTFKKTKTVSSGIYFPHKIPNVTTSEVTLGSTRFSRLRDFTKCLWMSLTHLRLKILESKYLNVARCNLGPATSMTVLGIEQDFVNQVARLPEGKLLAPRELIHSWMPRRWFTKRELESLIGHLHHAAKVVWPGTAFLRRFIAVLPQ